jgi:hypothetical protein
MTAPAPLTADVAGLQVAVLETGILRALLPEREKARGLAAEPALALPLLPRWPCRP